MKSQHTDYTDHQIGALKIIKRIFSDNNKGITWLAACQCGKEITITTRSIKRQAVPSCGCQRPLHKTKVCDNPQELTINKYLKDYKYRAHKTNLEWGLSEEEFKKLIGQCCTYCGLQPSHTINIYNRARFKKVQSQASRDRHERAAVNVSSIDREDSQKGYTSDNCVSSCMDCNYGKYTKTKQDFLNWVDRVYKYQHAP
jgi:hypothetical protein